MSPTNVTQNQNLNKCPHAPTKQPKALTRRALLANLAGIVPLAAVALAGCTKLGAEQVALDSTPPGCAQTCDCLLPCPAAKTKWHKALEEIEFSEPPAPPYGPESRTVLIDACLAKIDEVIISLERFYDHIAEARALPPSQVDGAQWIKLEYEVIDAELKLDEAMQSSQFFEDALEAATGKRAYYWCIKQDLIGNQKLDLAFVQSEINAFREDYPGQVAELQAIFNARYGGES